MAFSLRGKKEKRYAQRMNISTSFPVLKNVHAYGRITLHVAGKTVLTPLTPIFMPQDFAEYGNVYSRIRRDEERRQGIEGFIRLHHIVRVYSKTFDHEAEGVIHFGKGKVPSSRGRGNDSPGKG